jgi:hypothetical protein
MTTGQEVNPGDKGDGNLELGKWDSGVKGRVEISIKKNKEWVIYRFKLYALFINGKNRTALHRRFPVKSAPSQIGHIFQIE